MRMKVLVTGNGRRTYISDKNEKKICQKFWFLVVDFQPDPLRPFGEFDNSLQQHAVPSGLHSDLRSALLTSLWPTLRPSPRARRAALKDFQTPLRTPGIWVKIPSKKPDFSI